MTRTSLALVIASVVLSSVAQILLKAGMSSAPVVASAKSSPTWLHLANALIQPLVFAGLACYFASAIVWLLVLSRLQVSVAYPLVALGFVLTALLAFVIQGEPLTLTKMVGIAVIVLGVAILAQS